MTKMTKSQKKRKRRKLSKLLKSAKTPKKRLPTCKGPIAFASKKDYKRSENKKIAKDELSV
jgi:hypothetical protein